MRVSVKSLIEPPLWLNWRTRLVRIPDASSEDGQAELFPIKGSSETPRSLQEHGQRVHTCRTGGQRFHVEETLSPQLSEAKRIRLPLRL